MATERKYYTITQAAARTRRTRRTIENWIADGLEVTQVTNGKKITRYVEEAQLLATLREKLRNNPSRATKA